MIPGIMKGAVNMGIFLNSRSPCADYREMVSDLYFVDKSMLITELIPALEKKNRYFCISRPRRFGKSVMANMICSITFHQVNDFTNRHCWFCFYHIMDMFFI